MVFTIRETEMEHDMDYFLERELEQTKANRYLDPSKPDEELINEIRNFLNKQPVKGIFIAETPEGEKAGYIWVAVRMGGELWDFEDNPAWIYDIQTEPKYRKQGLGKQLLIQAEQWAKKQSLERIGLHVFGTNKPAINLYRAMSYSLKNCYFQKNISPENIVKSAKTLFRLREKDTDEDEKAIFALAYENFKALVLAGKDVPEEKIRAKFEKHINAIDFKKRKDHFCVAEDEAEAFAGFVWFYVSKGDLGEKEYVWMVDLEVGPAYRGQGLSKQLLGYAEQWTKEHGFDTIRLGVHGRNKIALKLFRATGYSEANLFMQKQFINAK